MPTFAAKVGKSRSFMLQCQKNNWSTCCVVSPCHKSAVFIVTVPALFPFSGVTWLSLAVCTPVLCGSPSPDSHTHLTCLSSAVNCISTFCTCSLLGHLLISMSVLTHMCLGFFLTLALSIPACFTSVQVLTAFLFACLPVSLRFLN